MIRFRLYIFGRNLTETMLTMLICCVVQNFNSGDDHSDCPIKVALARILHCEVTLSPTAVNQYFVRKYIKTT